MHTSNPDTWTMVMFLSRKSNLIMELVLCVETGALGPYFAANVIVFLDLVDELTVMRVI